MVAPGSIEGPPQPGDRAGTSSERANLPAPAIAPCIRPIAMVHKSEPYAHRSYWALTAGITGLEHTPHPGNSIP